MTLDVDACISTLQQGECVSEKELRQLCQYVSELLMEESNVQPVLSPVTVVGDLHGQFFDLLNLLKVGGWPPETSYVFLGDFVDRGHNSVETLSLLLCLKFKFPGHVTLLRGNHESRQITQVYGFYDECLRKYGNASVWRHCVQCFDCFGLAALIDEQVLCVHGGLSPDVRTLDQVRAIDRNQEIPHEGAFCDLVWSDPEDIAGSWQLSPRGAGYLFGKRVTDEFHQVNNLQFMARAHQLVMEGRKYHFDKRLVTVWSAPNYCYRCGNVAAILEIGDPSNGITSGSLNASVDRAEGDDSYNERENEGFPGSIPQRFQFFRETPESVHGPRGEERAQLVPYFL
ncbi:calcineurin-like phosphoesterase [Nitzschia inconspicua]|uniref:Serine/threonine-protein phosphatase n=1 Tax=Nitzschia inconspicua TaxID=303405 RepID=A0A9K3PX47_9STRA|nr:calcineurin-like phosphoesterase [Nitzschia inconspicua]